MVSFKIVDVTSEYSIGLNEDFFYTKNFTLVCA